jgi:two-component system sensor histidine kinase RegB
MILGTTAASNLALALWRPATSVSQPAPSPTHRLLGGVLALDVLLLSALLYVTGGPTNPCSFLYLVHIALAAVLLDVRWTWALVGLSSVCSALLFVHHVWLPSLEEEANPHAAHMREHLYGMWVAMVVAAVFIVYFVSHIRQALAQRDRELERTHRLAALATLSAGAAHELATPLSTIALVAGELSGALQRQAVDAAILTDIDLMRSEVERCRAILTQMAADAGHSAGELPVAVPMADLLQEAIGPLTRHGEVAVASDPGALVVPKQAFIHAIRAVVRNGQQAAAVQDVGPPAAQASVVLEASAVAGGWRIAVRDNGCGMDATTLAHVGEPFFTTKEPGQGMGLGLFLVLAVLDRLGGRLEFASLPGRGTTVTLWLPGAGFSHSVGPGATSGRMA